ncbi:TCR/Tet family MFS transporter [Parapedobacter tibetensis]|uniref:TCR/Tet family MFS transporter n=1 Tax=Parapedobacter tibetensis TaxID=2972951 RepID=UPI00214D1C29|nr:TCR/Tet family MFS transporter [Parapedobacter tibetensis]
MRKPRQSALAFIFITVIIDVIGLGIIIPVMPTLIQQLIGGTLSEASKYGGWLMFAYASTQFFFASVLGNLSDRFGRRPVLLFSLLGFCINYLLMGLAPSILWLFIGRLVAGVTGASHTVAAAYIADVSTPDKRAQNFGLLGAAFGIGFIIGPVLGGLLGHYGPRIPFFAAAALSFINFAYGYFIVPESLTKENRRAFSWRKANPVGSFKHIRRFPEIGTLVICIALVNIAAHAVQSTWAYYTMERYGWNERMVGISLGFVGILLAVVQAGLLRIIIPKIGAERSVIIGLSLYTMSLPLMAFASESWVLYAACVPYVLAGIAGPAIQGIISNRVPHTEQGQIQGGLTGVISLTAVIGPPLMTWLFAYFTRKDTVIYLPGAPFILGAVLTGVSVILAIKHFMRRG